MSAKDLSILIVDDDLEDLELLQEIILGIEPGAVVHCISNAKEVINFLSGRESNKLPCLIILDYNMPEMNGAEVLSELNNHRKYQSIPKVILSTSNSDIYIQKCMQNGALNYFVKPGSLKELELLTIRMLAMCSFN
jgi:CheY-like chemotaxis protein